MGLGLGAWVSGTPLGGATSVIQFDDITAMVAVSAHWEWGGLNKEQWIPRALLYQMSLAFGPYSNNSVYPCKSLVPLEQPVHC